MWQSLRCRVGLEDDNCAGRCCRQSWKTTFAVLLSQLVRLGDDDLYGRRTELKTIPNVGRCSLAGAFVTLWVAFVTSQVAAGQLGGEDDFWGRFRSAQLTGLVVADRFLAVSISHVSDP